MRKRALVGTVAIVVAVTAAGLLTPAASQSQQNTFTVVKVVEGPVPAGAVFEVTVDCEPTLSSPATEGFEPQTFQFDETGDPIGDNSVEVGLFVDCTAEETVTNGATVSYACEVDSPNFDAPEGPSPFVPVECIDDQTVHFDEVLAASGTITVTNLFEEEPPPPPEVVADVVTATPPFTG